MDVSCFQLSSARPKGSVGDSRCNGQLYGAPSELKTPWQHVTDKVNEVCVFSLMSILLLLLNVFKPWNECNSWNVAFRLNKVKRKSQENPMVFPSWCYKYHRLKFIKYIVQAVENANTVSFLHT